MKSLKQTVAFALAFSMVFSSAQAFGQVPMPGANAQAQAVTHEERVMDIAKDLSDLTVRDVLVQLDRMDQNERADVLKSMTKVAEATKADLAALKLEVNKAQAQVDFEANTEDGRTQKTARIKVMTKILIIAGSGFGVYAASLIPYYKLKNPTTIVGKTVRVGSGVLGVVGFFVGFTFLLPLLGSSEYIEFPVENLAKLKREIVQLEAKIEGEIALLQILSTRYGI